MRSSDPLRGNELIAAFSRLMWDQGSVEMKEGFGPKELGTVAGDGQRGDFHSCG